MISPQNLAIGAAAVGLAGQEGDLFRKVLGWSLLLMILMCGIVYLQSTAVLDWMVVVTHGPGRAAEGHRRHRARPHQRQLATYESDGLLQYAVTPAAVVFCGSAAEVAAVVRACHEAEVPWVARRGSGLSGGALPVEEAS